MKSIRLSLLVYFLALLALALGAVSVLVYRTTQQTLLAKKEATEEQLQAQYEDLRREEKAKLDNALASEAWSLASLAQFQFQWTRAFRTQELAPLGLLTAGLVPNSHLVVPVWMGQGVYQERGRLNWGAFADFVLHVSATEIQFNEDAVLREADSPAITFFQINSTWGNQWRSRSMEERSLRFDPQVVAAAPLFDPKFDEFELKPDVTVRRVALKSPVVHLRRSGFWPRRPPPPTRPDSPSQPASSEKPPDRPPLAFLIQCAAETTGRDAALNNLQTSLQEKLDNLEKESNASLAALRNRLLLISLATFVLIVAGGFWLVRHGLSPLQRLSHAVSRVSERDFRLQFDEPRLPSELRPIVERLNQTLELLKRAFGREKQAAADISHELRTPLSALLTTCEVALRKTRSPEEYRELLEDCRASGQQMSQLVERMLALARLDAGVDRLRMQQVDVTALAEQCAALVRPLAQARGLSLHVQRNGNAALTADPDKLREVLTNLLHNAIEYNRPDGSVAVSVERENGHLKVEVRDTGIGISPQAREHIFERFYRADPSRQADGLHAGLGLSIVKGYVDLMGGTIAVESVEGQGSTFRVQLPVT